MVDAYNRIQLFLDTNILESYNSKTLVSLYDIKPSSDYYTIIRYINENHLEDKIDICIPEVVLQEIKEHLFIQFKKEKDSVTSKINECKNLFGSLIDISYRFSIDSSELYKEYVETMIDGFLKKNKCTVILYPRCRETFESIVEKAFRAQKPFTKANAGQKEYTDAGFKDALIVETIIEHCNKHDLQGVIFTNDNDLKDTLNKLPDEKVHDLVGVEAAKAYLSEIFKLKDIDSVKAAFENQVYLKETVLIEIGQELDASVTKYEVLDVIRDLYSDNLYAIAIKCVINEVEYQINVNYESSANSIVDVSYELKNE